MRKALLRPLFKLLEGLLMLRSGNLVVAFIQFIEQFKEALKNYLGKDYFVDTFAIEKDAATVYCLFKPYKRV